MRGWRAWAPARRFRRASIEGEGHEYFIVSVCFVVKTVLIFFVSIRVHSWFKCIIIFVYFVLFVVQMYYYFRVFRAFRGLKETRCKIPSSPSSIPPTP